MNIEAYNLDSLRRLVRKLEKNKNLEETLYLIFDYPYKYYTFKHFEV